MSAPLPVAIVGGGPVGLLLAILLARRGVEAAVLEARRERSPFSRAIGIHPPALDALHEAGVAEALAAEGVRVARGRAWLGGREAGAIDFGRLPGRWRFVLTLPQARTEEILEARLERLAPGALRRGARLDLVEPLPDRVRLRLADGSALEARWLAACDGVRSGVREALGIAWEGRAYPDRYVMGDAVDRTGLGPDAAVHLAAGGVVEAFPLPGGMRRWVARVAPGEGADAAPPAVPRSGAARRGGCGAAPVAGVAPSADPAQAARLARWVRERTGEALEPGDLAWTSAFGTERRLAARMAAGRVALAGDAAHALSPIGGQGMNLGWLDAAALAPALEDALAGAGAGGGAGDGAVALERWARARRRAALRAQARAEWNMRLGRPPAAPPLRDALVRALLSRPLNPLAARLFAMRL